MTELTNHDGLTRRSGLLTAMAAGLVLAVPAMAAEHDAAGAGSSLINPIMQKWAELARAQSGVNISYDPIGSGRGQTKILAREVDFGASDSPLGKETLESGSLIQFPVVVSAVVCVVNVPGIANEQLKLNGGFLAEIYTGKIKNWNDPKIVAINPGVKLPDLEIRPVSQTNLQGTTFVFTQYLLATNAEWREKFGPAITKRWAIGSAVASNAMVVETIKALPGSIGYTDYGTALANNYAMPLLLNKAGKYVAANPEDFTAAVAAHDWAKSPDLNVNLVYEPGEHSWPIVNATFIQIPTDPKNSARSQAVRKFLDFVFSKGGPVATEAKFVPLAAVAQTAVRALWAQVKG